MYDAITTGRIISAFLNHVPDTYVRDYTAGRGFLHVMRREKYVRDMSGDAEYRLPAETICVLNPKYTPRRTFVQRGVVVTPGWQIQLREAGKKLTPEQCRAIERELGRPVFRVY